MTLRRYCAKCSKFSISLILEDGRNITISFEGKDVIAKERFVDVEDKMIQEALEKTTSFNVYFYKSNEFDWMKEGDQIDTEKIMVIPAIAVSNLDPKKEDQEVKKLDPIKKEFSTVSAAKTWLHKDFGVSMAKLGNKTIVVEKALELGFEISFLNE